MPGLNELAPQAHHRVFDLVRELYGLFLRERLRPEYLAEQGAQQANWMQQ